MNTTRPFPPVETFRPAALLTAPIAADLEQVDEVFRRTLAGKPPAVARLVDYLRHFRGKRLRPMLLLLTAKACGRVTPAHHVLGAVVEMIHTATLVHDDVLDSADTRRHVATVNATWGNQASVLLGDLLFTHAFHLTSTLGDARACEIIGEATNRVCAGELLQVSERGNLALSEETYSAIIAGKTAALTACCCRLGASHAGAGEAVVERLAQYGRCLGMAFQIADDLLDLVGEEAKTGKTLGTDLEQQKLTLPMIRLLDGVPAERAAAVRQVLRGPAAERRSALLPLLHETNALGYARRKAEEYAGQAKAELACVPTSEARTLLERLADWSLRREK